MRLSGLSGDISSLKKIVENNSVFEKAKNYAFLLLKFRLRSEKELYGRLRKKKIPEKIIKKTISFLKKEKFIDDADFARSWIESRIKKPLGIRRLTEELRLKGIGGQIIERQIAEAKKQYSEEAVVSEITEEKFKKLKGVEIQKAKQRIFNYLVRRGFSPGAVIDAVNKFKGAG